MQHRLRNAAVGCHALLAALLALEILTPLPTAARLLVAAVVVAPLLATLPGLMRDSRGAQRWLAALLVPYIGGLCVEVVARAGAAPLLGAALLAAVAEIALLLALSRQPRGVRE
jgi:uncharacterized membrane protein